MKNNKKLIFALCAILAAAAIFVVSEKMTAIRPPEHRARFFPTLEERHINAIVVNDGAGSVIRLNKRDDGNWTVDGGDSDSASGGSSIADSGLVQIALEKIVSLKKGEPVSVNPDKQTAFDVGDTGKSYVKVYSGKDAPVGILLVGKNGPDWSSNYARLTGSDTVYLIPGGLRQSLFFGIDRWKKKEAVTPDSGTGNGDSAVAATTSVE
ncbi:MAG: DUF4340 domain-containing protein [Chitinispirillales bacterium]|jgi:hypothetical protein|nr:DUF4340 domain-containing protein [Chitinispirillales bacterium]